MALRVAHARDQRSASLPICRTALGFFTVEPAGAVLLGYWEDFFVPIESPTKSVMLTDIGDLEARLRRVSEVGA